MAYCLFCTQNHMTRKELKEECSQGKWLPMLIMRTEDNDIILPCFDTVEIARQFIRRNLPKDWVCGTVDLHKKGAQWMDAHGWKAIKFTFPRKLKDVVQFDVEILEFEPGHNLELNI